MIIRGGKEGEGMSLADYTRRLNQRAMVCGILLAVGICFTAIGILAWLSGYPNSPYLFASGVILAAIGWFFGWRH